MAVAGTARPGYSCLHQKINLTSDINVWLMKSITVIDFISQGANYIVSWGALDLSRLLILAISRSRSV
jgi:hypothetical protein